MDWEGGRDTKGDFHFQYGTLHRLDVAVERSQRVGKEAECERSVTHGRCSTERRGAGFRSRRECPPWWVLLLEVRMETRRQGQTISERSRVGAAARGKRERRRWWLVWRERSGESINCAFGLSAFFLFLFLFLEAVIVR
jgi:hypothetical protein